MSRNSCPWSRRSRRCVANPAVRVNVLAECKEIAPTTPSLIARCCGSRASNRFWRSEIPNMAVVWAFIAGWLSGLSVGSINCVAFVHATNDVTTSMKPSSLSDASSFAATSSKTHFVRRSKPLLLPLVSSVLTCSVDFVLRLYLGSVPPVAPIKTQPTGFEVSSDSPMTGNATTL